MAVDLDAYNDSVKQWSKETEQSIKSTARALGIQHRTNSPSRRDSINAIKGSTRQAGGQINRVGFRFPRHLVFVHKGAGRGQGGSKGSQWMDANGNRKRTAASSLGKMGTGNRKAKAWFNTVIDGPDGVDKLATIAAEKLGDYVTGSLTIQ